MITASDNQTPGRGKLIIFQKDISYLNCKDASMDSDQLHPDPPALGIPLPLCSPCRVCGGNACEAPLLISNQPSCWL